MACPEEKTIPVLDTRVVLLEHFTAKVGPLFSSRSRASEAIEEIENKLLNQDIIHLLENERALIQTVSQTNGYRREKEELGEELFCRVSDIEPDFCAKITGMLLELDNQTIRQLFECENSLVRAVEKSKEEYLTYTEESRIKEEIGENLYDLVSVSYSPEVASHLTGMLLEMKLEDLKILLTNQEELGIKLQQAYDAYLNYRSGSIHSGFRLGETMASHQELADFIKKVHVDLRISSRLMGAETAWEQHCHNTGILEKYSMAMRNLATSHWDKNNAQDPNLNRIYWVVRECEAFYCGNGWKSAIEKERKMIQRYFDEDLPNALLTPRFPLKLLDVGSCYNPFQTFNIFNVTAIDIAPASGDVIKCDFLNFKFEDYPFLVKEGFDVVLFSFLLEYLPHPKMRFESCFKAYSLLRPGGILIILTPDSKHDSANSKIMKSWRQALAKIGFIRTTLQKLKHLRCMTFYKCLDSRVSNEWLKSQAASIVPEECIVIPQDVNPYDEYNVSVEPIRERSEHDNHALAQSFGGLAGSDLFID